MDLALIAELKRRMKESEKLSSVWEYFLDNFGEDREFMGLGEAYRSEELEKILGLIGGKMFGGDAILITEQRLIEIPGHHFVHGGMLLQGHLCNILYAADLDVGVLGLPGYPPGQMQYVRFSLKPLRGIPKPSVN